jgi:hypothetical protein
VISTEVIDLSKEDSDIHIIGGGAEVLSNP